MLGLLCCPFPNPLVTEKAAVLGGFERDLRSPHPTGFNDAVVVAVVVDVVGGGETCDEADCFRRNKSSATRASLVNAAATHRWFIM